MAKLILYINFFPIYKNVGFLLSKKNKEWLQKRLVKDIKMFLRKRKTKSINMVKNDKEIYKIDVFSYARVFLDKYIKQFMGKYKSSLDFPK